MSDNIQVAIKVRPLIKREKDEQARIQWTVKENTISHIGQNGKTDTEYQFDHIFDTGQTNKDVFEATAKPIVDAAMKGFNGTIFAYGQTSSGKTYTMMGSNEEPGVIPLAVNYIFNYIENDPVRIYLLRVSYLEIYNEKIHDLLRKDHGKDSVDLKIKEDIQGNIIVDCLAPVAESAKEVLRVMKQGDKARRVGDTNMNERSSRSHTIFRIQIESCEKDDPDGTTVVAQLNLIDLAGSERARSTGATGERFNEGRHINLSLSTLSLVIKQLSDSCHFVSFRDSKLTRTLQTSLGGNTKTTIICAVTPAAEEETECTLAFARRAKGIKNKPQVNDIVSEQVLIKKMVKQVNSLKGTINDMESKLQEKDKQILWGRIELLSTKMVSGQTKEEKNLQARNRRRTWGGPDMYLLPPSATSFGYRLPTIIENDQTNKVEIDEAEEKKKYAKRRQSVMQQVDCPDSSFQIQIPDFELELIMAERERLNRHSSCSTDGDDEINSAKRTVQFAKFDDICEDCSPGITPEKLQIPDRSPSTPKAELRSKLRSLESEFQDLREFTKLEKQVLQEDRLAGENYLEYEKNMAFLKQSLADSEQVCKDTNKKYSELQSEFTLLSTKYESSTRQCENLTQQVNSLEGLRDDFTAMEVERNELKTKWMQATKRIEILEGESSSYAFEMEHMKKQSKNREDNLKATLDSAWDELKNVTGLDKDQRKAQVNKKVAQLQSLVDDLNEKLSSSSEQNVSLTEKVEKLENELSKLNEDNCSLIQRVEEFDQRQEQFDNISMKIIELEAVIADKDGEIKILESSKAQTDALTQEIQDMKNNETQYLKNISQLEETIAEKESQIIKHMEESSAEVEILSKKFENLTENQSIVQEQYSKNVAELEEIIAEKESQIENFESTQMEITSLSQQLNDLKNNEEEYLKKINELEGKVAEKENLEDSSKQVETLLKQVEELTRNQLIIQEEYTKKITQLEAVIAEKEIKLNENSELASKYLDAENKLQTNNELIDKLKPDIDEMQLSLEEKNSELSVVQSRLEELKKSDEDQRHEDTTKLIDELSSLKESMIIKNEEIQTAVAQIKTQDAEITRFKEEINLAHLKNVESIESQKNELLDTRENIMALESEIAERNDTIVTLEKLLKEKTNKLVTTVEEFNDKMKDLENKNNAMKKELDNFVGLMIEKDEKLMTIPTIEEQLNNACLEKEELIKEINQLRGNLQDVQEINKSVTDDKKSNSTLNNSQVNSSSRESHVPGDNESGSIFANESYFANMDISVAPGDSVFTNSVLSNKTYEENSINNETNNEHEKILNNSTKNTSIFTEVILNNDLTNLSLKTPDELKTIIADFVNVETTLEEVNSKLEENLKSKIRETEELKNDFKDFKLDMENLQKTVQLLSSENGELAGKLSGEKETLNNMKLKLENEIDKLKEEKEKCEFNLQDEKSEFLLELEKQVADLTKKNNTLYSSVTEKNQQLDVLKDQLKAEVEKNKILTEENLDLSNNLMDKIEEYDAIIDKMKLEDNSKVKLDNSTNLINKSQPGDDNNSEINLLVSKIVELKLLNSKLIDKNLTSCSECVHLAEKVEFRKMLKEEVKAVSIKLNDLQKKFDQESAEAEILRSKVNEDHNVSLLHDTTLNSSILDGVDVVVAEEKIQLLQTELDNVQQNYEKLATRYDQQSNEIERLREASISPDNSTLDNSTSSSSPEDPTQSRSSIKREKKLSQIKQVLKKEQSDINYLKKRIESVSRGLEKLKLNKKNDEVEIDSLKSENKAIEEKLIAALAELEKFMVDFKDVKEQLEKSETKNNEIKDINSVLDLEIVDLKESLNDVKEKREKLLNEFEEFKSTPPPERQEVVSLNSLIQEYKENTEQLESSVKDLKNKLEYYTQENLNLHNELAEFNKKLESEKVNLNDTDNRMEICDDDEPVINGVSQEEMKKALEELNTAKSSIKQEIASLNQTSASATDDQYADKTVTELFHVFITVIMTKEQEIIKKVMRDHEKEKRKLVENLKELEGAKIRLNNWSKELEADVERLSSELSSHEEKTSTFKQKISDLENLLKECEHEKSLMKEKMDVMETDFSALQIDYEKLKKGEVTSAIQSSQNIDKQIEKAVENCQVDYCNKIKNIDKDYKSKIDELMNSLENFKTKNLELQSNLDCQEANERQLKSIVDLKTSECVKFTSKVEAMEKELKELQDAYNQINQEHSKKSEELNEITGLFKQKCDKLSEYKIKLETVLPDYENIKEHVAENDLRLEKYKSEAQLLSTENAKMIDELRDLKDKLESEKINRAGLIKQLANVTNSNTVIQSELEKIREKCEEFETENHRLLRRMRNSTDKETAKQQTVELIDQNRALQQNLDGVSNRLVELQNVKSELLKAKTELETKYNHLDQEYAQLNNLFSNYKKKTETRRLDMSFDEKYDNLLHEKNKIALELEDKKSYCRQCDKKIKELEEKNKELDEEMDDMLKKIEELDCEKDEMAAKLFDLEDVVEKERVACQCGLRNSTAGQNPAEYLKKQNEDLKLKLKDALGESKSTSSSRSSSPAPLSSIRKQRRSDLFNQNRPSALAEELIVSEDTAVSPCQCEELKIECESLRQKIITLDQALALSINQGKSLQLQIDAEQYPYKKLCKEHEERIHLFIRERADMKKQIQELLQRPISVDCQKCKNWINNKKDQSVQCIPMKEPISLMPTRPSGIIQEHAVSLEIEKLKSDKSELKRLCISRRNQIVDLTKKYNEQEKELEKLRLEVTMKNPSSSSSLSKNCPPTSKENVSSNIMGPMKMTTPHRYWYDNK